jgi:hypothetical protein
MGIPFKLKTPLPTILISENQKNRAPDSGECTGSLIHRIHKHTDREFGNKECFFPKGN